MRFFMRLLVAAGLVGIFASVLPAFADADVTSYTASCSTFSGSGRSDSPYAVIYVETNLAGKVLLWFSQPVRGGKFKFDGSFSKQPKGTALNYYVWGSPTSDPNDYDKGDYFEVDTTCKLHIDNGGAGGPIAGNLLDGRINNEADLDVAAPVAIYQDAQKTLSIWAIDPSTGTGTQAVNLSWSAINAQGVPTDANLVLSDTTINGLHIIVSRLTTGEIQVNVTGAGVNYIVVWSPDHPEALYHLLA